jgi:hypothetical protein
MSTWTVVAFDPSAELGRLGAALDELVENLRG